MLGGTWRIQKPVRGGLEQGIKPIPHWQNFLSFEKQFR